MTYIHYPVAVQGEWEDLGIGGPPLGCFNALNESNLIGNTPAYCTIQRDPTWPIDCGCCLGGINRHTYLDFGQLIKMDAALALRINYEFFGTAGIDSWVSKIYKSANNEDNDNPLLNSWVPYIPDRISSGVPVAFTWADFIPGPVINSRWVRIDTLIHYGDFGPPLPNIDTRYNYSIAEIRSETTPPLPPPPPPTTSRLWIYKSIDNGISWTSRGVKVL